MDRDSNFYKILNPLSSSDYKNLRICNLVHYCMDNIDNNKVQYFMNEFQYHMDCLDSLWQLTSNILVEPNVRHELPLESQPGMIPPVGP